MAQDAQTELEETLEHISATAPDGNARIRAALALAELRGLEVPLDVHLIASGKMPDRVE